MTHAASSAPLALLHEGRSFVVVDKPAGLACHATRVGEPNVLERLSLQCGTPAARWHLGHRLDRETSGCLFVARNPGAQRAFERAREAGRVERRYLAWVEAERAPQRETIDAPIARDPAHPMRRRVHPSGRPARTHVERIALAGGIALLAVRLSTGRTHQIRVHLAHLGCPLLGDALYGGRMDRTTRLALHASTLELPDLDAPRSGRVLRILAALPEALDFPGLDPFGPRD